MLSKRQIRVLEILRQPNLVLKQEYNSAKWVVGEVWALSSECTHVSLMTKEVADLERLGHLTSHKSPVAYKCVYRLA